MALPVQAGVGAGVGDYHFVVGGDYHLEAGGDQVACVEGRGRLLVVGVLLR